jgi:hypothetical protein
VTLLIWPTLLARFEKKKKKNQKSKQMYSYFFLNILSVMNCVLLPITISFHACMAVAGMTCGHREPYWNMSKAGSLLLTILLSIVRLSTAPLVCSD